MRLKFLGTVNRAVPFQLLELILLSLDQKLRGTYANEENIVNKDSPTL